MFLVSQLLIASFHPFAIQDQSDNIQSTDTKIHGRENITVFMHTKVMEIGIMDTHLDGKYTNIFQKDGKPVRWSERIIWITSIENNKLTISKNGNRTKTSQLHVIHWNAGSKLWTNKIIQIEALLAEEKNHDLCFVSEYNLWDIFLITLTSYQVP